jgi:signal transduction histidine kinase
MSPRTAPRLAKRAPLRFGIGMRLYLGLAGVVLLTLAASGVAWFSFREIGTRQDQIAHVTVPAMNLSLKLAQQSAALAAGAPTLVTVQGDQDRLQARGLLDTQILQLQLLLDEFDESPARDAPEVRQARRFGDQIIASLEHLDNAVTESRRAEVKLATLARRVAQEQRRFERRLEPLLDDEFFFINTGWRSLDDTAPAPPEERTTTLALRAYRALSDLSVEGTRLSGLLSEAVNTNDLAYLEPLRERYDTTVSSIRDAIEDLTSQGYRRSPARIMSALITLGEGPDGVFSAKRDVLTHNDTIQGLLRESRSLADRLNDRVADLVADAERAVDNSAEDGARETRNAIRLLAGFSLAAVIGALLIGWLYVGRGLVRRIVELARTMRLMASGNLGVVVDTKGDDEVTDMAYALEVFRRHAIEIQRLNVVEQLNAEVTAKNTALENTLGQLRNAQQQIVMQEKMASLGQLTAGIAHEIKNPLNFVNNFAILSVDLLKEMREIVEKDGEAMPKDALLDVEGILDDLTLNLGKIEEHGKRADNIVRSMLDHSRQKAGERSKTDINKLVEEFTNLAYHGLRGQDRSFNSAIRKDFDPKAGEIDCFPQDLSRAVLNIVNNAFQATHEHKQKVGAKYDPVLWVGTKNLGDAVEIRIKDNGPGIPDSVKQKIFEPFFTTKPTGKGTGLGLSMTFDIVVQMHGGQLAVNTEVGEWTEFVLTIPRGTSLAAAAE